MTKEIVWEDLTREEAETLAALEKSGTAVYLAPILIEHAEQLKTLGITWKQVRTWHIGAEEVKVHLTPAPKEIYDMLLGDLHKRHRDGYRSVRCMVEGKSGRLIHCPDSNSCRNCPYGKTPDERDANVISWDQCIAEGYEPASEESIEKRIDDIVEYEQIRERLYAADHVLVTMVEMKSDGYSIKQIAEHLHKPVITIYKSFERIARIGNQYRAENN